jgi:hypothetical protein
MFKPCNVGKEAIADFKGMIRHCAFVRTAGCTAGDLGRLEAENG